MTPRGQMLDEYRVARHAHELTLEAACGTTDPRSEEVRAYYAQPGDGGRGAARFTWKEWLKQTREDEPEAADVRAACVELVIDADERLKAAVEEQARLISELVAVRDMQMADAAESGISYREIGRLVGVSSTIVGRCIARARSRR
jgi:tetrahydromethanopterin S-methyltransferase subunit H